MALLEIEDWQVDEMKADLATLRADLAAAVAERDELARQLSRFDLANVGAITIPAARWQEARQAEAFAHEWQMAPSIIEHKDNTIVELTDRAEKAEAEREVLWAAATKLTARNEDLEDECARRDAALSESHERNCAAIADAAKLRAALREAIYEQSFICRMNGSR